MKASESLTEWIETFDNNRFRVQYSNMIHLATEAGGNDERFSEALQFIADVDTLVTQLNNEMQNHEELKKRK